MMHFMVYGLGPYKSNMWDVPSVDGAGEYHCYGVEAEGVDTDQWGGILFYCFPFPEETHYRRIVAYWAVSCWVWFGEVHGKGWPQDVVDIFYANSEGQGQVTDADVSTTSSELSATG